MSKKTEPRVIQLQPHGTLDQPTPRDHLGFRPYVSAVAEFLTDDNTRSPFTLSVEGKWGSGKSSFMRQLARQLRVRGYQVVEFNPWRHEKDESLWAAFVLACTRQLQRQNTIWLAPYRRFQLFLRRFDWRRGWLDAIKLLLFFIVLIVCIRTWQTPAALLARLDALVTRPADVEEAKDAGEITGDREAKDEEVTVGANAIEGSAHAPSAGTTVTREEHGAAADSLPASLLFPVSLLGVLFAMHRMGVRLSESPLAFDIRQHIKKPDYDKQASFLDQLHDEFRKVLDVYVQRGKCFVIIDDLDRCEVPRAADLLQAINLLVADRNPIVTILGLDRRKVAAGLAAKHKDLLPFIRAEEPGAVASKATAYSTASTGIRFGYDYLEKFIQLRFQLPIPQASDVSRFLSMLGKPEPRIRPSFWFTVMNLVLFRRGAETFHDRRDEIAERASVQQEQEDFDWELIRIDTGPESDEIRDIIGQLAPVLDYNPRRMIQLLNALRLRTMIAYRTGLLNWAGTREWQAAPLTIRQIAAFATLEIQWPRFVEDWFDHPELLEQVLDGLEQGGSEIAKYWIKNTRFIEHVGALRDRYSLDRSVRDELLTVFPQVDHPGDRDSHFISILSSLSRQQIALVVSVVHDGEEVGRAARAAGYGDKEDPVRLFEDALDAMGHSDRTTHAESRDVP